MSGYVVQNLAIQQGCLLQAARLMTLDRRPEARINGRIEIVAHQK